MENYVKNVFIKEKEYTVFFHTNYFYVICEGELIQDNYINYIIYAMHKSKII